MTTFYLIGLFLILPIAIYLVPRMFRRRKRPNTLAFFHPYCNAGGGGERVLWQALDAISKDERYRDKGLRYVIYTGDTGNSPSEILDKVSNCFGIHIPINSIEFVYLRTRWMIEAKYYPFFTLLLQMIGGFIMGCEALWKLSPEIFIDTTGLGCPMTLPVFRWIGEARVVAYVHYPTITTDMIQLVSARTATYNNSSLIAKSRILSAVKVVYYKFLSCLYQWCGWSTHLAMVNSNWTYAHISQLWSRLAQDPQVVHPPCDAREITENGNRAEEMLAGGTARILSVGQIRPEKNHAKQLRIISRLKERLHSEGMEDLNVKLVIAGGCRGAEDIKRVASLKKYAAELNLSEDDVEWHLNVEFHILLDLYKDSLIGIHTMWNEHFGIAVVEGLAAGLMMIAHKSGGPKLDIIGGSTERCGFLADEEDEYAEKIVKILRMPVNSRNRIRGEARRRAEHFAAERFNDTFCDAVLAEIVASQS